MKALRAAEVGSYVYFGEYEQDDDASTGKEAIEWLVLAKEENRMLLISRYGLDAQQYHIKRGSITWEDCSLRNWLNTSFLETAFISEEKDLVVGYDMTGMHYNSEEDTFAEKIITDKVFLLSISMILALGGYGRPGAHIPGRQVLIPMVKSVKMEFMLTIISAPSAPPCGSI